MSTAINFAAMKRQMMEEARNERKGTTPAPLIKKAPVNKKIEQYDLGLRGCGGEECVNWINGIGRTDADAYNPTHNDATDAEWESRIENSICFARQQGATRIVVLHSTALKGSAETYFCGHGNTLPKIFGIGGEARYLAHFDLTQLNDAAAAQQVLVTLMNAALHVQL